MADEKRIIIEYRNTQTGEQVATSQNTMPTQPSITTGQQNVIPTTKTASLTAVKAGILGAGAYIGKQTAGFLQSSVKMYTGDERLQEQVDLGVQLGTVGVATLINPALGLMAALSLGLSKLQEGISLQNQFYWENVTKQEYKQRLGITSTSYIRMPQVYGTYSNSVY